MSRRQLPPRTRPSEANTISNTSFIASPHGAAMPYNNQFRNSIASMRGSADLERLLLRKVDRSSKVEIAVDMEVALEETGQGKFQCCLFLICGLIYSCCSLSTTTLSFVLPAATCDFALSSELKGTLNIMPVAGMMIGSYVWGSFADSKGRKFVLVCSLLIDGMAGVLSSLCQEKYSFLVIRIFNGFGIIGSVSVVFAYLGEFLTDAKRDKALSSLEIFWTLGIVAEPIIGYLVIPQKWRLDIQHKFIYNSWRLYVFLCGLPSLIMGLIMIKMPESPRFLLLQGKLHQSRKVLELMFKINTGRKVEDFPVKILSPSAQTEFYFFKSLHDISTWGFIKKTFIGLFKLHVFLFRNCLKNIFLTSYIDFGLNYSYNTLINWVPELLNNMNHWEHVHGKGYTICEVEEGLPKVGSHIVIDAASDFHNLQNITFVDEAKKRVSSTIDHDPLCEDIGIEVYIETLLVCLCCLPTTFAVIYSIQFISKKILLDIALFTAGIVTVLLTLVREEEHLLYLMCMFEAFTTVIEAILFCIVVEIFPDQVRGIALCLTVTMGRFGAVVGNFIFGSLITTHCLVPFYSFCFLLMTGCVSVCFFPPLKLGH